MEKYDNLGLIGEGSYGVVTKCKHKESGQIVAIKKFLEPEDDPSVRKIALREIRMLKRLRHDNLINLIEVFRKRKKLYLVFEFMDHTILDELELSAGGLNEETARKHIYQVLQALQFIHQNNVIHRDVKPENILVSKSGIIKLCDFGFARAMASPGELYTDYVATRWYRAPELLIGDLNYGKEVDIWAVGCLYSEILTGDPLFPGESDIDQIYQITKTLGPLCGRHRELMSQNPVFSNSNIGSSKDAPPEGLTARSGSGQAWSPASLAFVMACLAVNPHDRPQADQLIGSQLFTQDGFGDRFGQELSRKISEERGGGKMKTPLQSNRNITNKQKENRQQFPEKGFQTKIRRLSENESLFEDVLKKAAIYSEKYMKLDRLNTDGISREPSAHSNLSPVKTPEGYGSSPRSIKHSMNNKDVMKEKGLAGDISFNRRTPMKSGGKGQVEKYGYLEKAFERAFQFDDLHSPGNLALGSKTTDREPGSSGNKSGKDRDRAKEKVWLPSLAGALGRGHMDASSKPQNTKTELFHKRTRQNLPQV